MTDEQKRQHLNNEFNASITKTLNGGPVSPAITALLDTLATMIHSSSESDSERSLKLAYAVQEIANRMNVLSAKHYT
jgi:hypothetical protein